jgi:CRISPR system Cascade subunit CasE
MNPLYLSKIEIDYDTAHLAGLRDSYAWHQKVWQAFPDRKDKPREFLTRLDENSEGFRMLLLSIIEPSRPDWCPEPSWETQELPESFLGHNAYQFTLLANPTKKVKSAPDGTLLKNSRRVPLVQREALLEWLQRKAGDSGFAIVPSEIRTAPKPRMSFIKKGKAGHHAAVEFTGTLTVTDSETFQRAVANGIGSAKAFGFGMLCLTPIH